MIPDWVSTPAGTAVLGGVIGAMATQLLSAWARRRAARASRRDQLVAAAVALVAAAADVQTALNLHAARWLDRRARFDTIGMATLDWWAGKEEHGPATGAARAVRTALQWNRDGLAIAAGVAGPRAVFAAALGRWTVLVDPRDLDYGLAVSDALDQLARAHTGPARRRRAAARALDRAGVRVIAAARARGGASPRRHGDRRAGRRILRRST